MTSTTHPSIQPSARARRTYTWLLALAVGPGLVAVSCSDDAEPDTLGTGGTAGSSSTATAGSGGSSSGGSAGAAAGAGGSSGANSTAGSGGTAGNTGGEAGTVGLPEDGPDASTAATFTLTSPAFDGVAGCGPDDDAPDLCDLFPEENTGLNGAANISPRLEWTGVPAGTQSFAIAFHDLSNIDDDDTFTHWVMWNIPASSAFLPAELPEGQEPGVPDAATRQVSFLNTQNDGFAGSGAAGNVYEFVLYALSVPSIDPGTTDPDAVQSFIEELDDEILGQATLRARSEPND